MSIRQFIYLFFIAEIILSGLWYAGSAVTAVFLIIAGVAACRIVLAQQYCQVYALSKLMLLYLFWLFAVAWLSPVPETAMSNLAMLAGLPVMYLFATNTPAYAKLWQYLRLALFVMAVALALWAIGQVLCQLGNGRAQGPFQDRNLFAALMNLIWFPAAFVFLSAGKARFHFKQLVTGIGLFVISTALFATTSRGGIAAWFLLLPVLLWAAYRNHQSWRQLVLIILIAALAYLCSALLLNATIADRTFQLDQDPSASARLMLWQSCINMLLAHPVVGTGWGTFIHYYPVYRLPQEYSTAGMFAHNDYLQLAIEGGVPALVLQLCILFGVLTQLQRSLKYRAGNCAFESVALLLGLLALFAHALLNFIFYQAVMNILSGLYLARVAQLTDQPHILPVLKVDTINHIFKRMFVVALLVIIALPYAAQLLGMAINNRDNLKPEHLVSDEFSVYKLAELITDIQPQERISQEIQLQTAERALDNTAFIKSIGNDFYRHLLDETLQRFEVVRALNANDGDVSVREANMLIRHHAAFDRGVATSKAHQVLNASLKADPYHVDSIIALSRLQRMEGSAAAALQTMNHARTYIFRQPDKKLLYIEWLRQVASETVIPELEVMEKELREVNHKAQAAQALVLPENYYEDMDARLDAIAHQIRP